MDIIIRYFPDLDEDKIAKLARLQDLYSDWNSKINVISRKDIVNLYERHVLHSLAIAKVIPFTPGTSVVDIGTGGGFPAIPLAILFPETEFFAIDSVGKKIKVVDAIAIELDLKNIHPIHTRAEDLKQRHDFVLARAVTTLPVFVKSTIHLLKPGHRNCLPNGFLYLKGGEVIDELSLINLKSTVFPLKDLFSEDFFLTKYLIHLSFSYRRV